MRKHSTAAVLLMLAFVAGCETTPPTPAVDTQGLETRAANAEGSGDLAQAARLYLQLAELARGEQRSQFLIESARLAIAAGDNASASQRLASAVSGATRAQQQTIDVYRAQIELEQGRAQAALDILDSIGNFASTAIDAEAARVRGRALFALDRPVEAVRVLAERELWLDDGAAILENQRLIWDGLRGARSLATTPPTGDPVVDGWLELAPAAAIDDPQSMRRDLLEWRAAHSEHPAARVLLADLLSGARELQAFPRRIALLLPLSTSARDAALAVQHGFLAARLESNDHTDTRIELYDTGAEGAAAAYLRAQVDGADFIVGPLRRQEVDSIVEQAGFVPTLALNFSQSQPPAFSSFYQFALAPEDEARNVAERGFATGARTAIAVVQSDERGYRILSSFVDEFQALGGEVLGWEGYNPQERDFSAHVERLLNVDRSNQRNRQLEAILGQNVAFEPRRRQDVDMIFLSADAPSGRLLMPQLQYDFAGDIPTYSTSEVYDPGNSSRETDLNNLIFPDLPWLVSRQPRDPELRQSLQQYWPSQADALSRYYAFGFDAYAIVEALHSPAPSFSVDGLTGRLAIDADGRIHRSLPFAEFRDGRPEPLDPVVAAIAAGSPALANE